MAVNSVRHDSLCNNSGLWSLLHGFISLPDATSCDYIYLDDWCITVVLFLDTNNAIDTQIIFQCVIFVLHKPVHILMRLNIYTWKIVKIHLLYYEAKLWTNIFLHS